jgi:hypothetical protein
MDLQTGWVVYWRMAMNIIMRPLLNKGEVENNSGYKEPNLYQRTYVSTRQ